MSLIKINKPQSDIAIITLNRPERMNAMAFDLMDLFIQTLKDIGADNSVRVVIITGEGEGFCSGADLVDPGYLPAFDGLTMPGIARRAMDILEQVIKTIQTINKPVIAAINGPAIGGGLLA